MIHLYTAAQVLATMAAFALLGHAFIWLVLGIGELLDMLIRFIVSLYCTRGGEHNEGSADQYER